MDALAHNRASEQDVTMNGAARIGYYCQDFRHLQFGEKVIDALRVASDGKHTEHYLRGVAARFFLRGEIMQQVIGSLSEGQKGLVSLTCLVLQEPSILIVDEPTNHLNFRHLPAVQRALSTFKGGMLLVSHDAEFVKDMKFERVIDLDEA
ncbi:ABC-F family ATP-binding cassette domain-containing protein [archaeon]|nr:MAG: ABC-F family ATP-binding cassette domain-containing protein [archaeon]